MSTGAAGRENALALASPKTAAEWMDGMAARYSAPGSPRPSVYGIAARILSEEGSGLGPQDVPEVIERVLAHFWLELRRAAD